ncbi:ArsR/SmtB family transcription factor [Halorussus litoreus]|uniref:ArsR/SmtB family transcription factor n=1 Tax=Halorussus litoreus TaxID=1710536 RepID=UPI000E2294B3|nr:winged helix-turn-helix domain-containing protein [Halorussus litoreus]
MADLLPSTSDASAAESAEPRVIGVDSDDADDLLAALSPRTARELLAVLHDEPATPSELAEAVDTSLQNAQYHLGKLEDAEIIEAVDTVYSEKGREMTVYAPADRPLVVFAGEDEETAGLKAALSRLVGSFGALGLLSVAIQEAFGDGVAALFEGGLFGGAGGAETTTDGGEPTLHSADAVQEGAAAAGNAVPPGVLFFAGGALVLALGFAWWYYANRRTDDENRES